MPALSALEAIRDDFRNVHPQWRKARIIRDPNEPDRLFAPPEHDDALDHFDLLAFEAGQLLSENVEAAKAAGVTEATFNESKPEKRWLLAVFDILGPNVTAWGIDESSNVFTHSALAISRILAVPDASPADNQARALFLANEHPDWTNKQIAEAVGVNPQSVYRWPAFKKLRKSQKSYPSPPPGRKTDGIVESFDNG